MSKTLQLHETPHMPAMTEEQTRRFVDRVRRMTRRDAVTLIAESRSSSYRMSARHAERSIFYDMILQPRAGFETGSGIGVDSANQWNKFVNNIQKALDEAQSRDQWTPPEWDGESWSGRPGAQEPGWVTERREGPWAAAWRPVFWAAWESFVDKPTELSEPWRKMISAK